MSHKEAALFGRACCFALLALSVSRCGSGPAATVSATQPQSAQETSQRRDTRTDAARPTAILAAGDIVDCKNLSGSEATAKLLDAAPGTVLTLGDNAYPDGSDDNFRCYEKTWGRHKARTRPAPGNHEYHTPGAAGYFHYFGTTAGSPNQGYYSFDLGAWHIIALNSQCSAVGGCGKGSPQEQWLRDDLAKHPSNCTLAYWHVPRFSSGDEHGNSAEMQDFWQDLYAAGADIVLNGHDHDYERFAPQTPEGMADSARGIREFVVGTGGKSQRGFRKPEPNSEVRSNSTFGVLEIIPHDHSYDWKFLPIAGHQFTDSGSGVCHSR